jgi:isopenicillin N synthase-like dioxygenase
MAIPIIHYSDLLSSTPSARYAAIHAVGQALEHTGFFILDRHPISPEVIRRAHQTALQFFALPEDTKQRYQSPSNTGNGGFSRFGSEKAKNHPLPDLKEFWHVSHTSFSAPDAPWPVEIPGFRPIMTRLFQQLLECSQGLLEACATYLGQPQDWLTTMTWGGKTVLRLAHYPPIPPGTPPGSFRAAPHEDINLITLLCEATTPGLEILTGNDQWIPIQAAPGEIVVDIGDMLQNLTNGVFKSTTHRVTNPNHGNQRRLSMPFFVHPRPDTNLSPLAPFIERRGGVPYFPSITAAEYLAQRLQEIQVPTANSPLA